MTVAGFAPLAAGDVSGLVGRYRHFGPALAALLTNVLATVGDKGQLAVITLATVFDSKRVFLGAVSAFACWTAVEVTVGTAVVHALPPGAMRPATGGLFFCFGAWACYQVYDRYANTDGRAERADLLAGVVPGGVSDHVRGSSGSVVAFVTVAVAAVAVCFAAASGLYHRRTGAGAN